MAQSKLIDLALLTTYDEKIKALMATEDAKSLKSISYDSSTRVVSFFKTNDGSGTAAYTVTLPETSNLIPKLTMAAAGDPGNHTGDFVVLDANGALTGAGATIAAQKITIVDAGSLITATNVEDALQELATASAGGVDSKTVYITETAGSSSDLYSKRYGIYQGSSGTSSDPVVAEKLADIDIPKDMVVESGSVVDIVFKASDNTLHEGSESGTDVTAAIKGTGTATAADAGKYIKLVIANSSSTSLYIKATDLVDVYTPEADATQIQLAIDSNNVISATVVAGSIDTTELAAGAVTTAKIEDGAVSTLKIADDAVTADKVSIAAHTVSHTAGADGVAVSVTTTDGQVSAVTASIAANTYDAYGTGASEAAAAVAALDSNTSSATDTTDSGLTVLTEVGITDGLIATKKSHTLGSAADCADTDFLKTADYTMATTQEINDLFN